ncbi:MAG: hypothetical protein ACTSSE_04990 [Candidatus Thorarchaeota archaeon]
MQCKLYSITPDPSTCTSNEWLVLCALEGTDAENETDAAKIAEIISMYHGTVEVDEIGHHEWAERFYPMRIKRLGPSVAPSEVYVPLSRMVGFIEHCNKHFKGEKMAMEFHSCLDGIDLSM